MSLRGTNTQRKVRRAEEEADAFVPLAARHLEGGADAVHRDETELPDGRRIGGAGDEHPAQAAECRLARVPVPERQQRMDGATGAVVRDRTRVGGGCPLRVGEYARIAAQTRRMKERAVRLLRRVREVSAEAVDEDRGSPLDDGKPVAPQAKREPEPE